MIPHHVALLAHALRPSLVAADSALQAIGVKADDEQSDLGFTLLRLNSADNGLADAFRELAPLIERTACPDEEVYDVADSIRTQLRRLIAAHRASGVALSGSGGFGERAPEAILNKVARDALVAYAHFLAELIQATAQPASIIANGALPDGNNHWTLTLSCKTNLPDSVTALANWLPVGLAYDQNAVNRALRLSAAIPITEPTTDQTTNTVAEASVCQPAKAGLSFWEILGVAGIFSLLTGCDHDE
jgi:hypothetical protein